MTYDLIGGGALLALVFGAYGFTWAIRREGREGRKALHAKIETVARDISACQTKHAEQYATNDDIRRLDQAVGDMRREINQRLDELMKVIRR